MNPLARFIRLVRVDRTVVVAAGGMFAVLELAASGGAPVYEVAPSIVDAGGGRAVSANYTHHATLGGVLGAADSAAPVALRDRRGYVAQLFDVQALVVGGPLTVAEGASATFTATAQLDDGTTLAPAPTAVAWNFTGAGQTISAAGEFFAPVVYLDAPARVNATWRGTTGGADLLVLDTLKDNFGAYAGDGLRDLWQVQYFGEASPLAAPTAAPFGDGVTNQLKHAWNVPPDDRFNAPVATVGGGFLTLTYRRLKASIAPRPTYRVQVSGDLATWLDDTSPGAPFTTELSVVTLNAETELVTVRDNTPLAGVPRRFIRLRVSWP